MDNPSWRPAFRAVFDRGMAAWQAGRRAPDTLLASQDVAFLRSIGASATELFDFVDDLQRYGEPDYATAEAIAGIRRDYFLEVLQGRPASRVGRMEDLPAKTAAVEGITWLPRLIEKARWKLRGEMPDDLMYGCGGDRAFIKTTRLTLPGFLRLVWECGPDDRRIIDTVRRSMA